MELVIKAKVTDQQNQQQGAPPAQAASQQNDQEVKAVEKAVQEVLDILNRKNER